MRLFPALLLFSFSTAEYWTVHINSKLKCNGKAVKERLHYEVTDTNYTRFDRVTRGRTRAQGWIIFTATKRFSWVPLITIYHKCGIEKDAKCYKTANIPVPQEVMSTKFPRAYNLTGTEDYLNLGKLPSSVLIGTNCSPYFLTKKKFF